jgi:hypothetical protein
LKGEDKTIKAAGSRGQAVDQKVEKYERERLEDLALLKSGDLVEIELVIHSKNDYEYLVFEDFKAPGAAGRLFSHILSVTLILMDN